MKYTGKHPAANIHFRNIVLGEKASQVRQQIALLNLVNGNSDRQHIENRLKLIESVIAETRDPKKLELYGKIKDNLKLELSSRE